VNPLTEQLPIREDPSGHPWWPVMCYEYLRGAPFQHIADTCGLSLSYTRQLIYTMVDAGRLARRPRQQYFVHDYDAMVAARARGATVPEIAEAFGCSPYTVYRALRVARARAEVLDRSAPCQAEEPSQSQICQTGDEGT
jgi:hypothetical protein